MTSCEGDQVAMTGRCFVLRSGVLDVISSSLIGFGGRDHLKQ